MTKAFIYWNLHKRCWSIRVSGRVIAHASQVQLRNVVYRVNEKGRQRVLAKRKKEVHAGVKGDLESYTTLEGVRSGPYRTAYTDRLYNTDDCPALVGYNPYKGSTFINKDTGEPIMDSESVLMCSNAKVYAFN